VYHDNSAYYISTEYSKLPVVLLSIGDGLATRDSPPGLNGCRRCLRPAQSPSPELSAQTPQFRRFDTSREPGLGLKISGHCSQQ
jgi:hypothetical protein